ncbi:MAG: cupredoxin domain-containing protein [Methanobacteriota archaeon]
MLRRALLSFAGIGTLLAVAPMVAGEAEVLVGKDDEAAGVAYLRYYPETVVVWEGDEVVWKADSGTPHTVTQSPPGPSAFDSSPGIRPDDPTLAAWFGPGGFLMPGQSFNHTFNMTGTFSYFCKIHPGMQATVRVVNASDGPSLPIPGTGAGNGTRPIAVFVDAGWGSGDTTVVWTNKHSAEPHTVTGALPDPSSPPSATNAFPFDSSPRVGPPPEGFAGPNGTMIAGAGNPEFRRTFATAGTFNYFCKLHPGMWGAVIVLEQPVGPADDDDGGIEGASDSVPMPGVWALGLALLGAAVAIRRRRSA